MYCVWGTKHVLYAKTLNQAMYFKNHCKLVCPFLKKRILMILLIIFCEYCEYPVCYSNATLCRLCIFKLLYNLSVTCSIYCNQVPL